MKFFTKQYIVRPNMMGYLFRENKLEKKLGPGYHEVNDFRNRTELITIPETKKMLIVTNQEVLTQDNVALRFSFYVIYRIADGEKLLASVALDRPVYNLIFEAEQRLINVVQVGMRKQIATLESEQLNEKRNQLGELKTAEMEAEVADLGLKIEQAQLKDITFPKAVQDLFAKHLEAKIRSKTELENARTAVATARALKNASELMKGDENIRFMQVMETITKIAEKGKHTFMIGDLQQIAKK
jgi:regulator of protease activity HflC (stomatin/prohibitin superfamily)